MKWKHIRNLKLNSPESSYKTTTVVSVVIHETFNAIYWTETEPQGDCPNSHKICRASLLPGKRCQNVIIIIVCSGLMLLLNI